MSKIPQGEWTAIAARYENGESISKIARSYGCTPPAIHYILKRHRRLPAETFGHQAQASQGATPAPEPLVASWQVPTKFNHAQPTAAQLIPAQPTPAQPTPAQPTAALIRVPAPALAAPLRQPADDPGRGKPASSTPGLDRDLHHRAEAAIEVFRTSFDAALTEGSPGVRERLRQAASDLMRVAARTTIVLDRLNAVAERSARAQNYPRSAHHGRDETGHYGPG